MRPTRLQRLARDLFAPVDGASLAVLRIVLGLMIVWDVVRYFQYGWIDEYYIAPKYSFPYLYFEWVRPWPGNGMYWHFAALGVLAAMVSAGLFYRFAMTGVWLLYTYKFLLEESVYMNHYYLIGLLCFVMIFMQPHRVWSLDRWRHPEWPQTAPWWNVLLLRYQLVLVYGFGALAKLNADWLRGEPMYSALVARGDNVPEIAAHVPPWLLAYGIAYGGIVFDAVVPVLLCVRRTRWIGFGAATVFHLLNDLFLRIGVFSYLMTGAITLFFEPDWPRRVLAWLRQAPPPASVVAPPGPAPARWSAAQRVLVAGIAAYALVQFLLPLRHFLYPGNVSWTEEGHRFSWHMKLRSKTGQMRFIATDRARGLRLAMNPEDDLRWRQVRKLHTFPDMVLLYAHYKAAEFRAAGIDPEIRVEWYCSLNGAPPRLLVDPRVDLTTRQRSLWPADWILR